MKLFIEALHSLLPSLMGLDDEDGAACIVSLAGEVLPIVLLGVEFFSTAEPFLAVSAPGVGVSTTRALLGGLFPPP